MTGASRRRAVLLACALAAALAGPLARADEPSPADRETARALMDEGVARRERGDPRGALASFQAADALMHVPTTGLEVGRAQADVGQLLAALDTLLRVARSEPIAGESRKLADARTEAARLAESVRQRIPSLRVRVTPDDGDEARVTIDGVEMRRELRAIARKVDPGAHVVVVARAGVSRRVEVSLREQEERVVEVALTDAAAPAAAPPTRDAPPASVYVFGLAFGAAALGVGVVTGALAMDSAAKLRAACAGSRCPPPLHDEVDRANTLGTASTVAFVATAVALVGTLSVWLLAPRGRPTTGVWIGPGSAAAVTRF